MPLHTDPSVDEIFAMSGDEIEFQDIEPPWAKGKLKKGNKVARTEWTRTAHVQMMNSTRMRANRQIKNLALWIGIHYRSQNRYADFRDMDDDEITIESHKVIVNNIYDVERNRYSKISRNLPQTVVTPRNSSYQTWAGSKSTDQILKTVKARVKQQNKCRRAVRDSFIFGEAPLKPWWDKARGPVDPRWEAKVKLLKDPKKHEYMKDEEGNEILIDPKDPIRIGDHVISNLLPWEYFPDPVREKEDCSWIIFPFYQHVEAAKRDYPGFEAELEAEKGGRSFDPETLSVRQLTNHVLLFDVYCRSTKYLQDGCHWVQTANTELVPPEDNPYEPIEESEWGNLPIEVLTDIDIPGRLHGYSTIQILENLQHSENQMGTMIKHYLLTLGTPKMLVPSAARIDMDELSDDSMSITFSGEMPPSLLTPAPVSGQIVEFWNILRDRIQKLGDLHGVSSGDLPPNVKAAKAIRLLQELEDLRATSIFNKYNDLFVALDRKLICQMKNYHPSDGRLATMLGKDNEYLIEDFNPEDLTDDYTVELEVSGSLPQAPSARAEFILETWQQTGGNLIPPEKLVKLLGWNSEKEFIDQATVSVVKAQRENDKLQRGKKVESPLPHENHLVELREHYTVLQSPSYTIFPKKVRAEIIDHVRTTEYLAWIHAQKNPVFRELLFQTVPQFPTCFVMPQDAQAGPMGTTGGPQPGQQQALSPLQGQQKPGAQQQPSPQQG